ncbi:MarR family winged helix-turn-helix transcriptional regulator [Streptomyces sp. NPDC049881]|uniref:MarR family winged helix-turn-helix transcriptional regulator n=1 Tax=Streptomyces sp. NPDC049881 TaxID=3155778 RepID=UPI003446C6BF
MAETPQRPAGPPVPRGTAFLLAQVGARAAERFAERVGELGVRPADVGLLRLIGTRAGLSQRDLAETLGVVPSRVVALVDRLDGLGLVERHRSARDRRHHELRLSARGEELLGRVGTVAAAHEDALLEPLTPEQRETLGRLLGALAYAEGLTPGVHPGYRGGGGRE